MFIFPRSSARRRRAGPAPEPAGFTLIELLVALVVTSIVIGVVFQVLSTQSQFARTQSAREEVQQNARVALELIASELRGIAPGGIVATGPDSIRFRAPRAWGLLCTAGVGGASVLFPAGLGGSFRAGQADSLAVLGRTVRSFVGVQDVTTSGGTEVVTCNTALTPSPAAQAQPADEARARRFTAALVPPSDTGAAVFLYDAVRYDVGTSAGISGSWIRRNNQPMAGPVPAATGLRFVYRRADGSAIASPTAVTRDSIAQIDVTVRTESQARFSNAPQQDTASTTVYLRNRP